MDLGLNGKKALVMGSSAGLGKAVAQSLIDEGVEVAICARTNINLLNTKDEIGAKYAFPCDLTTPHAGKLLCEQALEKMGQVDILVTNTGGPAKGTFMEISSNQWLKDYQSIWLSVTDSIQTLLPSMQNNQYGRILMITSIAAQEPIPALTTSNGLRAGLNGLAKSICHEVAGDGITVNTILPGYTNTDRLKNLNLSEEKVKEMVPAGRLGEPRELADLVTFLSSNKGAYITGQTIAVDGGVLKSY